MIGCGHLTTFPRARPARTRGARSAAKTRPAHRAGREWYDDAQKTRKRRRNAEHAASGPQLTPEVPRAAFSLKTAYPAASGMSMMNLDKYPTFKTADGMSPALTFHARVIYCFWQGRSPCYPAFSAFASRGCAGKALVFAPYKNRPRGSPRGRLQRVKKASQSLPPAGGKKSEIIFSRDMCVRENTAQAASVEFVRHRHTNSARSRLQPLCRKTLRVFRQS